MSTVSVISAVGSAATSTSIRRRKQAVRFNESPQGVFQRRARRGQALVDRSMFAVAGAPPGVRRVVVDRRHQFDQVSRTVAGRARGHQGDVNQLLVAVARAGRTPWRCGQHPSFEGSPVGRPAKQRPTFTPATLQIHRRGVLERDDQPDTRENFFNYFNTFRVKRRNIDDYPSRWLAGGPGAAARPPAPRAAQRAREVGRRHPRGAVATRRRRAESLG